MDTREELEEETGKERGIYRSFVITTYQNLIDLIVHIEHDLCPFLWFGVVLIGCLDHLDRILIQGPVAYGGSQVQIGDIAVGVKIEGDDIGTLHLHTYRDIGVASAPERILCDTVYLPQMLFDELFLFFAVGMKLFAVDTGDHLIYKSLFFRPGCHGAARTHQCVGKRILGPLYLFALNHFLYGLPFQRFGCFFFYCFFRFSNRFGFDLCYSGGIVLLSLFCRDKTLLGTFFLFSDRLGFGFRGRGRLHRRRSNGRYWCDRLRFLSRGNE